MENYIDQLQQILEKSGWSQSELAKNIGVTFVTVNRWLHGHAWPQPLQRRQIERMFKSIVGLSPISDQKIQQLLTEANGLKAQYKPIQQYLQVSEIVEDFVLELTYNSDAIEGSTLSKKETEAIVFDRATIESKSLIEHLEAVNHAIVVKMIFSGQFKAPISEQLIKDIHKVLMQGIRDDAGQYARHQRAIRGVDLILPHPEDIAEEMKLFCEKVNRYGKFPVWHIAKMHADFEATHPFGDGNGRVGRLLMIIQLIDQGFAPGIVAINKKAEYYDLLEYAQKKSEKHFVRFLTQAIADGYRIIDKYVHEEK